MPTTLHTSHFIIKIDGANMPEDMYDDMEEVVVDTRLNLPGMFTFRLHDTELKWVDHAQLAIGTAVEISAAKMPVNFPSQAARS
jgi:hypothetical protein